MFGFVRNAAVIGAMAYFSPVHDQASEQRLEAFRAVPEKLVAEVLRAGPGLAMQAAGSMDAESRDALAAKIGELALRHAPKGKPASLR